MMEIHCGEVSGKGVLGRGNSQGQVLRPGELIIFKDRKKARVVGTEEEETFRWEMR